MLSLLLASMVFFGADAGQGLADKSATLLQDSGAVPQMGYPCCVNCMGRSRCIQCSTATRCYSNCSNGYPEVQCVM
jgi:hypothetical protein